MSLVDLARLERATSTFAQSRSDSIELQVLVQEAVGGSRQCLLLTAVYVLSFWRRRQDLNLHTTMRGGLANRCHTDLATPPLKDGTHEHEAGSGKASCRLQPFLAGTPGFEPRKSGLESEGLPVSLRPNEIAD